MNTRQLLCALNSDPALKNFHREVFALDQFKNAKIENEAVYIVNDQPSSKPGGHWFLVIIRPKKFYFIDSFSRNPSYYEIDKKLKSLNRPIRKLSTILQSPFSTVCGEYCLFFVYHLCRGSSLKNVLSYFNDNFSQNDRNVKDFVWRKYPGHERDYTNIFWYGQCN